jgi:hypothetical protein
MVLSGADKNEELREGASESAPAEIYADIV